MGRSLLDSYQRTAHEFFLLDHFSRLEQGTGAGEEKACTGKNFPINWKTTCYEAINYVWAIAVGGAVQFIFLF